MVSLSATGGASHDPEDNVRRSYIGSYYNDLENMIKMLLKECASVKRLLGYEPPPPLKHLISELDFYIQDARQDWLDRYMQLKEPKLPDNPADSVRSLCKLCLDSYEKARKATSVNDFDDQFKRLHSTVLQISGRASSILIEAKFPVSGEWKSYV